MSAFTPIRDAAGGIVGMQPKDETLFAQTLADTMTAVGATESPKEDANTPARQPWRPGRLELAGIVGGLILAAALIAALNIFVPAQRPVARPTAAPAPTAAPTVTIAPTIAIQAAYASPAGAQLGTIPMTATLSYRHSEYPGWAGVRWQGAIVWVETDAAIADLPDLAPPPTPRPSPRVTAPVVAPVAPAAAPAPPACNPLENPRYVVEIDLSPIGKVRGVSCTSQEEAAANAAQLAEQMRATAEGR